MQRMFRLLRGSRGAVCLGVAGAATAVYSGVVSTAEKAQGWPEAPEGGERRTFHAPDGTVKAIETMLNYQNRRGVQSSLLRNGIVGTGRDSKGSDRGLFGTDWAPTKVRVENARAMETTPSLDREGFTLLPQDVEAELGKDFNFYNDNDIIQRYYPSIAEKVKKATGATHVYAFDHNVRCASGKKSGKKLEGGNAVQGPAHIVHTDYTLTSAPKRLRDLSNPPKTNDTWRKLTGGKDPLIPKGNVEKAMSENGRFAMVNVWRNIRPEPVQRFPLAVMGAQSLDIDDLTTFEIHYTDRIGENYFVRTSKSEQGGHKWYYYPQMQQDELLVFKQWDSEGKLLTDAKDEETARKHVPPFSHPPPQFCAHSAIVEPVTDETAPDRESIEVRCILLYLDQEQNRRNRAKWSSTRAAAPWSSFLKIFGGK
eukprot:jgi/Bigna1/79970/fgenesh1_pg.66_\